MHLMIVHQVRSINDKDLRFRRYSPIRSLAVSPFGASEQQAGRFAYIP